MPAASAPGRRVRMEDVLGEEHVLAIHAQCRAYMVAPDRWHRVPQLARPWEVTAVVMLGERLEAEQGIGAKTAIESAAVYLGLEPDTIHSRMKRGAADAYRSAA